VRQAVLVVMGLLVVCLAPLPVHIRGEEGEAIRFRTTFTFFVRSNLSRRAEVTVGWTLMESSWSRILSKPPRTSPPAVIAYVDCQMNQVPEGDPDGFLVLMWRKEVDPYQIFQVSLSVDYEVSYPEPILLTENLTGTIEDCQRELGDRYVRYVSETYIWDYSNGTVQAAIADVRLRANNSTNVKDLVLAALGYIVDNFAYMYPFEFDYPYERLPVSQILQQRVIMGRFIGVCRHAADVFVAILRGLGVPARWVAGEVYAYSGDSIEFLGWHAWASVYFPGLGWHPIEVTLSYRSTLDITQIGLMPPPFYFVPEYIEYWNERIDKHPLRDAIIYTAGVSVDLIEETIAPIPSIDWNRVLPYTAAALSVLAAILSLYAAVKASRTARLLEERKWW